MSGSRHKTGTFLSAVAAVTLSGFMLPAVGTDDRHAHAMAKRPAVGQQHQAPAVAVVKCPECSRTKGTHLDLDAALNVRAGRLILYWGHQYASVPSGEFDPVSARELDSDAPRRLHRAVRRGTEYVAAKQLLVLHGRRAVTLKLTRRSRRHAALLYGSLPGVSSAEEHYGMAQVADGHKAIRFVPHPRGSGRISEFPGGLVVAGSRCVTFRVRVEGRSGTITRKVAYGRRASC
jgi:hypothetical protein